MGLFNRKKKQEFVIREEKLNNTFFTNRFIVELNKFGAIAGLEIVNENSNDTIYPNHFLIPIGLASDNANLDNYNEYLKANEEKTWEQILSDDTIEILSEELKKNNINKIEFYLTNDCTEFFGDEGFGILIKY